jgi:hypothetical protein
MRIPRTLRKEVIEFCTNQQFQPFAVSCIQLFSIGQKSIDSRHRINRKFEQDIILMYLSILSLYLSESASLIDPLLNDYTNDNEIQ